MQENMTQNQEKANIETYSKITWRIELTKKKDVKSVKINILHMLKKV